MSYEHAYADVVGVSRQVLAIHRNHDDGYHPQGATGVARDEPGGSNYENAVAPVFGSYEAASSTRRV